MGPQSFSTEQHVFCPTESSSGFIRILYSCSVKDYSFFFKYNSRESVFFFFKDVFSDYISFPLGIKKWRSILKQSVTKIEVGRTFQNTRPLNFSYRENKTKNKQTNKQKPEARNHCKHLYVQIPSLSKFECLRFADFMWITNCAQVTAVSVSVNFDTPTRLDSCLLGSDLLEKPKS